MAEATAPQSPPPPQIAAEDMNAYRDGFAALLWVVRIEGLVMLGALAILFYTIYTFVPQDSYFAIGVQGNREQLLALKEPNMNRNALLAWVSAATTQVMTFGFDDYDDRFAKAQQNFSPDGWKSFKAALERSGLMKNVILYQQILTAIPISTPMIQAEGILEGEYRWIVSVTLAQTVRAGGKKTIRYVPITMILVKMPTALNPMGVGINTWIDAS